MFFVYYLMNQIRFFKISNELKFISAHLLFLGCPSGYYGSNCSISCRYPNYGVECQEECHCPKKACDHVFGCSNNELNGKYGVEKKRKKGIC